jgi:hypothetical protein
MEASARREHVMAKGLERIMVVLVVDRQNGWLGWSGERC